MAHSLCRTIIIISTASTDNVDIANSIPKYRSAISGNTEFVAYSTSYYVTAPDVS
jgi:hypothetical protein